MSAFDFLPGTLQEIAELIGLEGALLIAAARGGGRLSIPSRVTPDSPVAKIVGMERAGLLSKHYTAGFTASELEIPLGPTGARASQVAAQARAIERLMGDGHSHEEGARRLRIASRTVRRHKAATRGVRDPRQPELF